jgi:hypothetical protein
MLSKLHELRQLAQKYGTGAAVRKLVDWLGGKTLGLQVVEVVWLAPEELKLALDVPPPFEFRFLTAEEVAHFAQDPANDLDADMIGRANGGRDLCFAALSGDRLAAYGWYALGSIEGEHNFGVSMSYPAQVAYMYKGFTHPDFRGARLHGLGMGLALKNLAAYGVDRLVSTVGWLNEPSLRSCDRLGYRRLGRLYTVGGERFWTASTPSAAKSLGVKFGGAAAPRSPAAAAAPAFRQENSRRELIGAGR